MSDKSYRELLEERAKLDAQIDAVREREKSSAIQQARELVREYGLQVSDVFSGGSNRKSNKGQKVAPKYRDPATGMPWTGRGRAPVWIVGDDRSKYLIQQPA